MHVNARLYGFKGHAKPLSVDSSIRSQRFPRDTTNPGAEAPPIRARETNCCKLKKSKIALQTRGFWISPSRVGVLRKIHYTAAIALSNIRKVGYVCLGRENVFNFLKAIFEFVRYDSVANYYFGGPAAVID
jgi:hypothetical protein